MFLAITGAKDANKEQLERAMDQIN